MRQQKIPETYSQQHFSALLSVPRRARESVLGLALDGLLKNPPLSPENIPPPAEPASAGAAADGFVETETRADETGAACVDEDAGDVNDADEDCAEVSRLDVDDNGGEDEEEDSDEEDGCNAVDPAQMISTNVTNELTI